MNIPKGFKKKKLKKPQLGYAVAVKRKGKFRRLNVRPLILQDSRDLLAYKLDLGLGRTARIIQLGMVKESVALPQKMKGYFAKNKRKFRDFRIRRGKKLSLTRAFIERKKFVGDTKKEIKKLQKAKRQAPKKSKKKRKVRVNRRKSQKKRKSGKKPLVKSARKPTTKRKKKKSINANRKVKKKVQSKSVKRKTKKVIKKKGKKGAKPKNAKSKKQRKKTKTRKSKKKKKK